MDLMMAIMNMLKFYWTEFRRVRPFRFIITSQRYESTRFKLSHDSLV